MMVIDGMGDATRSLINPARRTSFDRAVVHLAQSWARERNAPYG